MKIYQFTIEDARRIGNQIGVNWDRINLEQFTTGLNVELEHGLIDVETNVTNDDEIMTGKIALAHLKEHADYYKRLKKLESIDYRETMDLNHFYGYRVRQMYFVAAVVLLVGLPFVKDTLSIPVIFAIIGILLVDLLAALTNPKQLWINAINAVASVGAVVLFEYLAIRAFADQSPFFFVANQALALLFLTAIYLNTKTLRAMLLR